MAAPQLTFSAAGQVISGVSGWNSITVAFTSDIAYAAFECRATAEGEEYGVGKGVLVASLPAGPAGTEQTFKIYSEYLAAGDGTYRISLFAQGEDGSWNDNHAFLPSGATGLKTADDLTLLCMR